MVLFDGALLLSPEDIDILRNRPAYTARLEAYCGYRRSPDFFQWWYELDTSALVSGVAYKIETVVLDHLVHDGADDDGDGDPDWLPAGPHNQPIHSPVILDRLRGQARPFHAQTR